MMQLQHGPQMILQGVLELRSLQSCPLVNSPLYALIDHHWRQASPGMET